MGLSEEIRKAVETGKVILGTDKSIKALKLGQVKLVILAENCPEGVQGDVYYYAKLLEVPVRVFPGNSKELGVACGRPFTINVAAVLDPGESEILGPRVEE